MKVSLVLLFWNIIYNAPSVASKLRPLRFPFACTGLSQNDLPRRLQLFRVCLSAHQRRWPAYPRFRFLLGICSIVIIVCNCNIFVVVVVLISIGVALLVHTSRLVILLRPHAQTSTFDGTCSPLIVATTQLLGHTVGILVGFCRWKHRQRNFLQGTAHIAPLMLTVGCAVGALGGEKGRFAEISARSWRKGLVVASHSWQTHFPSYFTAQLVETLLAEEWFKNFACLGVWAGQDKLLHHGTLLVFDQILPVHDGDQDEALH